jgi:hypothetical protein
VLPELDAGEYEGHPDDRQTPIRDDSERGRGGLEDNANSHSSPRERG